MGYREKLPEKGTCNAPSVDSPSSVCAISEGCPYPKGCIGRHNPAYCWCGKRGKEKGTLRQGDRVKVREILVVDDLYGVIVSGKSGGESVDFPLCDLEAVNSGVDGQIVSDYGVWFANR